MNPLNFVSAFVVTYMCIAQGQAQCEGPCVVINECPHLFALINKPSRTPEELYQLRKAHCGHQGNIPKVCCVPPAQPDSRCYNPDGQPGQCIVVQSCPHLWKLVTEPQKYKENVDFLQNSICEGSAPYSVCCGPPQRPVITPTGICQPSAIPPDRRTECCGIDASQSNKIIGGNKTSVDQYPWLTIIEYRGVNDNKIKLLCGGSLISSKYVLTAGHCVIGSVLNVGIPTNVRLGEYDTNNDGPDCDVVEGGGEDCTDGLVIIPIETTIPYPMYDPASSLRRHDIALLRLKEFAPYTDFIRPICLPVGDTTAKPASDLKLYVAGWGAVDEKTSSSNVKLHVDLPFVSLAKCQIPFSQRNRKVPLWKGQLCAGGVAGKDSCKGDSGGPLMLENNRIFEIIGIVSFGTTPCGIENVPGVYTKVHYYNNWIRSQIKP